MFGIIMVCGKVKNLKVNIQGVSKKTLFNKIGTPEGPKTTHGVGDHSKMLSNTLYWSDVPIYPFS